MKKEKPLFMLFRSYMLILGPKTEFLDPIFDTWDNKNAGNMYFLAFFWVRKGFGGFVIDI